MLKRLLTLLLLVTIFTTTVMAESHKKAVRNQLNENKTNVMAHIDRSGLIETTILSEDFSKFTAGSEEEPDATRLDDLYTTEIDDAYFNSPGWSGIEIYQAGGCAYIGFSEEWGEPGLISTPLINTKGAIYIKCRMKSENPEGEIVGYNIVDEYWEAIDSNVDFVEITNEWTDVSWFTTSGNTNTYIYIFSYSSNVFIDDIEVVSCSMPTPVLLEETNITNNAFTANWDTIDGTDTYIFKLFADHTATAEETFYYTNTDFSNIISDGTISSPEVIDGWEMTANNWHIYMPTLINEAIGITGRYSSMEQFGTITSPVLDFSSDNGKVNISFKAYGDIDDELEINLITPAHGYYDIASSETIKIENKGWNEYNVTLTKGIEESYIEITYFGLNDIFFDDLKLYQTINEGETKTLTLNNVETENTYYRAKIDEAHLNDVLYYQVAASKFVYAQDGEKVIGSIDSEFTETRNINLDTTPQEAETIIVGEGDLNSTHAPISNYGTTNFSISQQIYTKEELNKDSGSIISISFQNKKGNSNTRNIVVYMNNTDKNEYENNYDWVAVNDSQIVFEGDFTFGTPEEWTTIELNTPFAYTGNNIVLTVYDKSENPLGYSGNDDTFYASATDNWRGIYKEASSKINVANLYEVYGYELKTSIYTTPSNQYYVTNIKLDIEPSTISAPNTPQNITAFEINDSSISLTWTNAKNATSYNVYCGDEKIANVTTTSYLAEGLTPNTEYCFSISALNSESESEKSNTACAKTKDEVTIPAIPTNVTAKAESTSSISLTWNIAENATSYNIYRGNEKIANVTTTSYTDEGLEYNTEYCYNITSVNKNNESEKSENACAKTKGECIAELTSSIHLYPNPANDKLYVETENNIKGICIYTVTGVMVYNEQCAMNNVQLDIEKFNCGVYFIKLKTENDEVIKRFIKQ